jgi:hypothetical protein
LSVIIDKKIHRGRPRLYKRTIGSLFRVKKRNVTIVNKPDEYFKQTWLDKGTFEAVDFLALVDRKTFKLMLRDLIHRGLRANIGEKISEYNKQTADRAAVGKYRTPTRFIRLLRRMEKEQGFDIKPFL